MTFLPSGSGTLVFIAFEGQDADASEAASSLVKDLIESWRLGSSEILDTDGFYEFRFSEPEIVRDETGRASIAWPGIEVHRGQHLGTSVTVIQGHEPGLKWREFLSLILSEVTAEDRVVLLGGLHAEVPHTRPLPVVANTEDAGLAADMGIEVNGYAGPIGILGLLGVECDRRGLQAINLWVGVPDYLTDSPSPKAELALASAVEQHTGLEIDIPILEEESRAWELGADELVALNPHLVELLKGLEQLNDSTELPEASGDAIAAEFERYLRKRGRER
ncbi:MAG: PAC2 family protein [Brevibacterium sp.]|uniref:proteasome assembly chaperone family protein n=1 Tax=Brevibacterium sp. TaxID=1701 RepID=UPI002647844C|nr:PAC2 family protein [Brevibacterium sp.]MDN5805629.1 PAC2 family protein [Brevibacterium sp.]MDN5832322.1 PAC2 family protein [Brevibacterium sp.]MDN5908997.1 PAC2 family protein [Brevibacterium sp.]MDN6133022.1 PAC2 family protein [Brevibacterium sp.]MDN6156598.1 PAC2 family protein [Brevibacterium sp.]